jgi:hypothetical protein
LPRQCRSGRRSAAVREGALSLGALSSHGVTNKRLATRSMRILAAS